MKITRLLAPLLLCAGPAAAQDASGEIAVAADATWTHRWTGLEAPPEIAGFSRDSVEELAPNQLDTMAIYFDLASKSLAAIYVFRPGLDNVSVWSDRTLQTMRSSPEFGATGVVDLETDTFTPLSGGGVDSGYIAYATLVGGDGKSGGMALFAHDGWLVKIRMSSATLAKEELAQRLTAFVAALEMPSATVEYPPASVIADCAEPIRFAASPRRGRADTTQLLVLTSLAPQMRMQTGADGKPKTRIPAAAFCRDQSSTADYGVYHTPGAGSGYVVAHGDAGLTLAVAKIDISALTGGRNDYWVTLTDTGRVSFYAPFRELPAPAAAIAATRSETPLAAALDAPGGGNEVIVSEGALGD